MVGIKGRSAMVHESGEEIGRWWVKGRSAMVHESGEDIGRGTVVMNEERTGRSAMVNQRRSVDKQSGGEWVRGWVYRSGAVIDEGSGGESKDQGYRLCVRL